MLVTGILLTVIAFIGLLIVGIAEDHENEDIGFITFLTFIVCVGVFLILGAIAIKQPTEKSLKDNTLSIEVTQEIINGQEISRDTIYIFTPKK